MSNARHLPLVCVEKGPMERRKRQMLFEYRVELCREGGQVRGRATNVVNGLTSTLIHTCVGSLLGRSVYPTTVMPVGVRTISFALV